MTRSFQENFDIAARRALRLQMWSADGLASISKRARAAGRTGGLSYEWRRAFDELADAADRIIAMEPRTRLREAGDEQPAPPPQEPMTPQYVKPGGAAYQERREVKNSAGGASL